MVEYSVIIGLITAATILMIERAGLLAAYGAWDQILFSDFGGLF